MYPDTRDESTELIKQIVALTTAAICLLMFFLPWVHVGLFSSKNIVGEILEEALGYDINELLSELDDASSFLSWGADYDEELKQIENAKSTIKSAVTYLSDAAKDNCLSPVELLLICLKFARVYRLGQDMTDGSNSDSIFGNAFIFLVAAGILFLVLMLGYVGAACYFCYRKLSRQRSLGIVHTVVYSVVLILFIALTVLINLVIKDEAENAGMMMIFLFSGDPTLHLKVYPFIGMVLLIASVVVQVALPDTTRRRMPSAGYTDYGRVPDYAAGREPLRSVITRDGAWNCACGNAGVTTSFCPRCGRKRPEPSAAGETSTTVVGGGMKPAYCERCGTPVPSGEKLCRVCAAAAGSAPGAASAAATAERMPHRVKGLDLNPDATVDEHVGGRSKEAEGTPRPRLKINH